MPAPIPDNHPLRRFFGSLVDQTFLESLGVCEPHVADYLRDLLTDFTHVGNIHKLRDATGRPLQEAAAMLIEAQVRHRAGQFLLEREVHRHIGDFVLFWTGVYPENLRFLRHRWNPDHLLDYVQAGKRSYRQASEIRSAQLELESRVLRRLSDNFEVCVYGLGLVRKEWERLQPENWRRASQLFNN